MTGSRNAYVYQSLTLGVNDWYICKYGKIGPRKKYSQDQMNAALEAVARGIPVASAAKIHSVSRVTLMYKSSGRLPTECRMGPSTVLTTN
ncbi:hypothetical protein JTB14_007215 [Gonioctena quinquepunctata]|nr:hypothetical protein JTB14_007215 [Gonioctena quinquepunctata]